MIQKTVENSSRKLQRLTISSKGLICSFHWNSNNEFRISDWEYEIWKKRFSNNAEIREKEQDHYGLLKNHFNIKFKPDKRKKKKKNLIETG